MIIPRCRRKLQSQSRYARGCFGSGLGRVGSGDRLPPNLGLRGDGMSSQAQKCGSNRPTCVSYLHHLGAPAISRFRKPQFFIHPCLAHRTSRTTKTTKCLCFAQNRPFCFFGLKKKLRTFFDPGAEKSNMFFLSLFFLHTCTR